MSKKYDIPAFVKYRRDRPRVQESFCERHLVLVAPFVLLAGLILLPIFAYEWVRDKLSPPCSNRWRFTPRADDAERKETKNSVQS